MTAITAEKQKLTTYEQDVVAWSKQQSQLILAGQFDLLDLEHIADEIRDVGKSEARELGSRIAVLIGDLLKYQYQPEHRPNSLVPAIKEQRKGILLRLKRTPSLKAFFIEDERFDGAYLDGRLITEKETGLDNFPGTCPWTLDEVLSPDWLPENK